MATVKEELQLSQSADTVWKVIGSFGGLGDWHPAIEKLELEENGKLRRLYLAGGGLIVERLEAHDDKARSYSYTNHRRKPAASEGLPLYAAGQVEWRRLHRSLVQPLHPVRCARSRRCQRHSWRLHRWL